MNFELLWQLAKTDFKIRYNGSILGYLWALLKPLLIFLILNFVFSNVFGANIPDYSVKLLVGIILWTYFSEGTMVGMTSLQSKANLITKVNISRPAIVIASTINSTITFLINLGLLSLFFIYYGIYPAPGSILMALVFIFLIYLLIVGFSFLTAPLFLKYRDLNQIWEVLLTLGFYVSPIIYPLELIPAEYRNFLWVNPMSYLIHYTKLSLIEDRLIGAWQLALLVGLIGAILGLGLLVFNSQKKQIAENL